LVRGLLKGRGQVARGFRPPEAGSAPPTQPDDQFDPRRASALLLEAGYPEGRGLPEFELLYNASPTVEQIMMYLQAAWSRVGVRVRLQPVSLAEWLARIERGEFDLYRYNFAAEHAADEAFYACFYGPHMAPAGPNTTRWVDPAYDQAFDRVLPLRAGAARSRLTNQLEQRLRTGAPAVFLFHPLRTRLVRGEVRGLPLSRLGRMRLTRAWLAP
jgi:ABC-type transport system substrate-binding protein